MNRSEAARILNLLIERGQDKCNEALTMAIEALNELDQGNAVCKTCDPGWIPCGERLPEKDAIVLVSEDASKGASKYPVQVSNGFDLMLLTRRGYNLAWTPLPRPWRGQNND